uniref:TFIIS N-terminal domain-containing protein n=1 Tax=Trichuris muris TaxID=70415 RepID=A0A5S6QXM7_TRIMR
MDVKTKVELLQQCLLSEDADKRSSSLNKLSNLPVTLEILLETGVGKTVNKFRADPVVGPAAKALVHKWKQIAISTAVSNGIKVDCTKPSGKTAAASAATKDVQKVKSLQKLVEQSNAIERKKRESSVEHSSASKLSRVTPAAQEPAPCSSKVVNLGEHAEFPHESFAVTNGETRRKESWELGGGSFEAALGMIDKKVNAALTKARAIKKVNVQDNLKLSSKHEVKKSEILKSLCTLTEQSMPSTSGNERISRPKQSALEPRASSSDKAAAGGCHYLEDVLRKKNKSRMQIYAGKKHATVEKVSSLFECCLRALCDNIDALGYTGGIPFDILRPILLRATPAQLCNIESYNPYLVEDTDFIWKKHCDREFVGAEPDLDAGETYRDLYERKVEERERRLRDLAATISASSATQGPVRMAKLADAKAPREVLRKQVKYGTYVSQVASREEVLESKRCLDAGVRDKTKMLHRVASPQDVGMCSRGDRKSVKPGKAPLMAKTLKMMKQCQGGRRY